MKGDRKAKKVASKKAAPPRGKRGMPLLPRKKSERRKVELLGGAALALFIVLAVGIFSFAGYQQTALRSPNVAAVVSAVLVDLANQDRTQNGLASLTVDPQLVEAAQMKANDMATNGYFAHVSPTGVNPWYWFKAAGYTFQYAGENLAVNFSDSGDVNTAWMNSPEHRANILNAHYTEIGIATAEGMYQGQMTTFVVQEFASPAPSTTQAPIASSNIPAKPTELATAVAVPSAASATDTGAVLGSAATPVQKAVQPPPAAAPLSGSSAATTSPALAASLAEDTVSTGLPLWSYLVGFPQESMHVAFYLLAGLILAVLVVDTGLEMKWHHRKKAMRAGIALAVVFCCFFLADYLFFAPPVLAAIAAAI